MVKTIVSDLFDVDCDFIAHQVNCQGVMGAGLAKDIRARYPKVYDKYRSICSTYDKHSLLGKSFICDRVISVFGQYTYASMHSMSTFGTYTNLYPQNIVYTDYTALEQAFTAIHNRLPIDKSIALPYKFGCGLANGNWHTVYKLICKCFANRTIYICKKSN